MKRPLPKVDLLPVWESLGGEVVGPDAGMWRKAKCPLHQDGTASAVINEDEGAWKCFTCDVGGDVFNLIMEAKGVGFAAAVTFAEGFADGGDGAVPQAHSGSSLLPRRSGARTGRRNWVPPWKSL
jgi:hypothetical protein